MVNKYDVFGIIMIMIGVLGFYLFPEYSEFSRIVIGTYYWVYAPMIFIGTVVMSYRGKMYEEVKGGVRKERRRSTMNWVLGEIISWCICIITFFMVLHNKYFIISGVLVLHIMNLININILARKIKKEIKSEDRS